MSLCDSCSAKTTGDGAQGIELLNPCALSFSFAMLTCQNPIAFCMTVIAVIVLVIVAAAALLLPVIILTQKPQYGEREEPDSRSSTCSPAVGATSSVQTQT